MRLTLGEMKSGAKQKNGVAFCINPRIQTVHEFKGDAQSLGAKATE
jgi:hypothetical protein